VAGLCRRLPATVMAQLVEPLCVSALNTPASRASAQVFLRVMKDALFSRTGSGWGASNLLLPRVDLDSLFPHAAGQWLARHGGEIRLGERVEAVVPAGAGWSVNAEPFDAVLLAAPPWEAARLLRQGVAAAAPWCDAAEGLSYEAIATTYVTGGPRLPLPMLALHNGPAAPAQFVFDRGQLGGPAGLLAFVASASALEREPLESAVLEQARQLGWAVQALQTVVEKRATFACTPALVRPGVHIAPGLAACGDYVAGPYPATLEGAVRSALDAVATLSG